MREHKRFRLAFYIGVACVALLFICAGVILHSQAFRNYALEQIVQAATEYGDANRRPKHGADMASAGHRIRQRYCAEPRREWQG